LPESTPELIESRLRILAGVSRAYGFPERFPAPPPWRDFSPDGRAARGKTLTVPVDREGLSRTASMVMAALVLRRPLLVTGKPGTGKSSLAYAVAHELDLGEVLIWPITTKTTLQGGLYQYDAIGRLSHAALRRERLEHKLRLKVLRESAGGAGTAGPAPAPRPAERPMGPGSGTRSIARFLRLGPLGTALLPRHADVEPAERAAAADGEEGTLRPRPRVLLIDEIDKADVDLPSNLLHVFERGQFVIDELERLPPGDRYDWARIRSGDEAERHAWVRRGQVACDDFPLVIMTSNEEREFPPAFLRRCLRLDMPQPSREELCEIVAAHLRSRSAPGDGMPKQVQEMIDLYYDLREGNATGQAPRTLAVDQLLNAIHLVVHGISPDEATRDALWRSLTAT
jgi:MoxR-like ATPase